MSIIEKSISFPLDDDGFFRRECPLCCREFKVLLKKEELNDMIQEGIDSFMIEQQENKSAPKEDDDIEYTCPYCGQLSSSNSLWTEEQNAYLKVHIENIMAKLVNENFIRPLKRNFGSSKSELISLEFKGNEMSQKEPWISPESNDLEIFDLPCCNRKVKIQEDWKGKVFCFFCGFPHEQK